MLELNIWLNTYISIIWGFGVLGPQTGRSREEADPKAA